MKIANKISLSFFAVVVILTIISGTVFYVTAKNSLRKSIHNNLTAVLASRADHIETYLKMLKISVGQLSKSIVLEDFLKISDKESPQHNSAFLAAMKRLTRTKEANPAIAEFLLMDKTGLVAASSDKGNIGLDESADSIFIGAKKEIFIKDVYYSENYKEPLMAVSAPILDSVTGELLGVLAARVGLGDLNGIVANRTGMGDTGEIYIVNERGYMITPSRFEKGTVLKEKVDSENVRRAQLHKDRTHVLSSDKLSSIYLDYRGELDLGAHEYIPQMRWVVISEVDAKEAFQPLVKIRLVFLLIVLLVPIAGWLLGIFIARLITASLRRLRKGIEMVGTGNLEHKVDTGTKDEAGQLSRAFDTMTQYLKKSTTSIENLNKEIAERKEAEWALRESEENFKAIANYTVNWESWFGLDGKYLWVNPAVENFTGYSASEILAMPDFISIVIAEEDRDMFIARMNEAIHGSRAENFEFRYLHKNGTKCWLSASWQPIFDAKGNPLGTRASGRDITERKRSEEALRESEEIYRTLFTKSKDAMMTLSPDEGFHSGNPAAIKMFACRDEKDFISRTPAELSPEYQPDGALSSDKAREMMRMALDKGSNFFEWRHKCLDGTEFPATVLLSKVEKGSRAYLQATVRDITERKRMEEAIAAAKDYTENIIKSIVDTLIVIDPDGKIRSINEATVILLGYKEEDLIGKPFGMIVAEEEEEEEEEEEGIPFIGTRLKKFVKEGFVKEYDMTYKTKSGEMIPVSFSGAVMRDKEDELIGIVCIGRDLRERNKANEALRESEVRYKALFTGTAEGIAVADLETKQFHYANPSICRMFGYTEEEFVRLGVAGIHPKESLRYVQAEFEAQALGEKTFTKDLPCLRKDGALFYANVSAAPIVLGSRKCLVGFFTETTENRKAEEALLESKELLTEMTTQVPGVVYQFYARPSGEMGFYYVSDRSEPVLGLKPVLEGYLERFVALVIPEHRESFIKSIEKSVKESSEWKYDGILQKPTGEKIWFSGNSNPSPRENEMVFNGIVQDISGRKNVEAEREIALKWQQEANALRQSLLAPAALQDKLKTITDGIVRIFDADFCRIWLIRPGDLCEKGCTHAEVKEGSHVCRYRDRCLHLMASSGRYTHVDGKGHARVPFGCYKIGLIASGEEHKFLTNDVVSDPRVHDHEWARELGLVSFAGYQLKVPGEETIGVLALFARHSILLIEDAMLDSLSATAAFVVQEAAMDEMLKNSQEQLSQASKMAAVCQLGAGAAHEINNPLAGIVGFTGAILMDLKNKRLDPDEIAHDLGIVLKNAERCKTIIDNLIVSARAKELKLQETDINGILDDALSLVEYRTRAQNIKVVKRYGKNLARVKIDADQMTQVFVNMATNAQNAMPDGGKLLVRTWVENNFAGIEFKDTGTGIEKENLHRIFEPFFTTNEPGKGVGLGLSVSHSIIMRHEGSVEVASDGKDKGASFIIKIPV